MAQGKEKYGFWTKYKKFAGTEILLYLIIDNRHHPRNHNFQQMINSRNSTL